MFKQYKKQYKEVLNNIKKFDRIVIFRHQRSDYDALGTQLGFKTWIKDNFPSKEVYAVGLNHSTFMPTLYPYMDEVDDSFFDNDFLAIIVDTANTERIDDERYKKAKFKIKFDHHPEVEKYGDVNIVFNELSSCAELVSDFLFEQEKKYPVSRLASKYLYSGIVGDSGRFLFSSTTSSTFIIASKLLECGINPSLDVYLKMYEKDIKSLEFQKYVLNNFKVSEKGVAYYILMESDLNQLGINSERGKEFLSLLSNIKGIPIWMCITEEVDRKDFRVSIRSKEIDISVVANKYKGGGHKNASGATLYSMDELDFLIKDLEALI